MLAYRSPMNSNPSLDKLEKLALAFQIKGRRLALPGLTALTSHFSWGDAMLKLEVEDVTNDFYI